MAAHFIDTSALVKRYHPEPGTSVVDELFAAADASIVISRLGLVEIVSAFAVKARSGAMTSDQFDSARSQVFRDIRRRSLRVARFAVRHCVLADELLLRYGTAHRLRTLDALQLATALDLRVDRQASTFVCADSILCELAAAEGLPVINPVVGS